MGWLLGAYTHAPPPPPSRTHSHEQGVAQGVLRELLLREEPQLMAHFDELQVAPSLVSTQWLLTCFVSSAMPLSALLRVWDCMFYEGHISFLFRACCALIKQVPVAPMPQGDAG